MTQPNTDILSLVEWLRKQSEENKQHAKSRRQDAEADRTATPAEQKAAKKMAEMMAGRKLTGVKIDKKSIAESIRRQERIADKLEAEARQLDAWADAVERAAKITGHIKTIMSTYREQEKSERGVDTPGGLEHMGDVWTLLRQWDKDLHGDNAC